MWIIGATLAGGALSLVAAGVATIAGPHVLFHAH